MSKKEVVKGSFKIVEENVFNAFFESEGNAVFIHGANCQKIMGSGVAKQVVSRIAPLYYLDRYDTRVPNQRLGSFSLCILNRNKDEVKLGVNLYTQFQPGRNFSMVAMTNAIRSMILSIDKSFTLYLPLIGCGIGGGDWEEVRPVLEKELSGFNVVVCKFTPKTEN